MRKILLVIFLLTIVRHHGLATHQIQALPLKDSVDVLTELGKKNKTSDPVLAERMTSRGLLLAQQEKYQEGEAKAWLQLGSIHLQQKKTSESTHAYLQAAWIFEKLGDKSQQGLAYNGLGSVYMFGLGNYTKAMQYYTKASQLLKDDTLHYPVVLINRGTLARNLGKLDEAMSLYEQAYAGLIRNNDLPRLAAALNNIASLLDEKKDYDGSISYYEKSRELNHSLENHAGEAKALLGLAFAKCSLGQHDEAQTYLDKVMALVDLYTIHDVRANALRFMAYESEHTGHLDKAKSYALKAEAMARVYGHAALRQDIYQHLSSLFEKSGDLKKALIYQHKCTALKDSLALQERKAGVELAQVSAVSSTKNATPIASLFWLWVGAGCFLSLVAVSLIMRSLKRRQEVPLKTAESKLVTSIQNIVMDEAPSTTTDQPVDADHNHSHLEVINGQGMKLIPVDNIQWFQKEGKSYFAYTAAGHYRVRKSISEIEDLLPKEFFRVNRAVIINTTRINNYSFWENHKYIIRMKDDQKSEFTISRNRLREMKEVFHVFEG